MAIFDCANPIDIHEHMSVAEARSPEAVAKRLKREQYYRRMQAVHPCNVGLWFPVRWSQTP
jgi:hypothetical protein